MKKIAMLFLSTVFFSFLLIASDDYISSGDYYQEEEIQRQEIQLPADFNFETANQELLLARKEGNIERADLLSLQINTYWLENRAESFDPAAHGIGSNNGISIDGSNANSNNANNRNESIMYIDNEENLTNSPLIPYWYDDVRIDPRNGIQGTSLVSLSNGELYCISKYEISGAQSILIRRSTDGGLNWITYWDHTFSSTYTSLTCPRLVECHDTLIISYVLENTSSQCCTWNITALPGNTYDPVYWGSSSGFTDATIIDYRICTDGALYNSAYVYAIWTEIWGSFDSTRVMYARSDELDVSSWEIGATKIEYSNGGAYFCETRIAHGSGGKLWIVAMLHPNLYPGTFDEGIRGWYSSNFGSTWDSYVLITPYDNGIDEYQPSIAGSHINNNWVCLSTYSDIGYTYKRICNVYSTDNGITWTDAIWEVPDYNFLPDIWVDDNSTAFFAVFRKDISSTAEIRYKRGNIGDAISWSGSIDINDDNSNLSNVYGPSIAYNYATGDAIIAWTNYNSYCIWFDDESWSVGIEEENLFNNGNTTEIMNIIGNPSYGNIDIRYTITIPGNVRITLFDVSGRIISEFVNTFKEAGSYELNLEPDISSGVYYISINSQEGTETKQLTFIR